MLHETNPIAYSYICFLFRC